MKDSLAKIVRSNNLFSIFFILILWFLFFFLYVFDVDLELSDYAFSSLFVFINIVIIVFRMINNVNIVSLYSLFYLTSLMFIGGRFFSIFLGYHENNLFEMNFFVNRLLTSSQSSVLFYIVVLGFLSLEIGLYFSRIIFKNSGVEKLYSNKLMLNNSKYILFFILFLILIGLASKIFLAFQAVQGGGYTALFSGQTEEYGFDIFSFMKILLLASAGTYLSQNNKKTRNYFLFFMGLYFVFDAFLGGRGGFICYLIFFVWYKYDCGLKRINSMKFYMYVLVIIIFLSSIFNLISMRGGDVINGGLYQKILSLLYEQGITLMVFNESMHISDYPVLPFFQNFFPGVSFIYGSLFGSLFSYEISFPSYISYSLNPMMFDAGYGLGWAFFSDAYQYGMGNIFIFCLFVFSFSIFINYLQSNISKNILIKVVTISLVSSILFLPRSGLYSVFPLIYYVILFFIVIQFVSHVFRK